MECRHEFTMCRLCLCESECFIDIFQENEWFGYVAAEIITDLLQLQVSETDGYPNVVCSICLGKLTDFKQFKEQCRNSRDTYNNVFGSDESHAEHTIDIVPSEFIKAEPEGGAEDVDVTIEVDHDPANSEEEETITDDIPVQVELRRVKLEPKDPLATQETQQEIQCGVASSSPESLARHRKRTCCESCGPYDNTKRTVNYDGKLSLKRGKKIVVVALPCEDTESSGSAKDKVGKMDIKARKDSREKSFACAVCDKMFRNVSGLRIHKLTHNGAKPHACDVCGMHFAKKAYLANHRRIHTGEKPYRCDVCGKKFAQSGTLNGHRLIHSREKPHVCEICNKAFAHRSDLIKHGRVHTGEKPFDCRTCGMRFSRKDHLTVHVRVHSGEKPYVCEECTKCFSDRSSLVRHLRMHSQEKPYACPVCSKTFGYSSTLRRHLTIHSR